MSDSSRETGLFGKCYSLFLSVVAMIGVFGFTFAMQWVWPLVMVIMLLMMTTKEGREEIVRSGMALMLAGTMAAVPIGFFLLLAHAAAAPGEGGMLVRWIASSGREIQTGTAMALIGAVLLAIFLVTLCFAALGFYHDYIKAEVVTHKLTPLPLQKGFVLAVEVIAANSVSLSLGVAAPLISLSIVLLLASFQAVVPYAAAWLSLLALPACLVGAALVDRGLWMLDLRRQFANLATSPLRSSAQGLVEVRGTIVPVDMGQASNAGTWFDLVDAQGERVRLELPPGDPSRVTLGNGGEPAKAPGSPGFEPGADVLVLGEFVAYPMPRIRPWRAPDASGLRRLLSRFAAWAVFDLGRDSRGFPLDRFWNATIGPEIRDIFLVAHGGEADVKRRLLARWWANVALGLFYLVGAAGLLFVVYSGRIGNFLP